MVAPSPPSLPSAAARVFAIPELLEQILIALVHAVSPTGSVYRIDAEDSYFTLEPATTIARCRMINSDFNGTISGSTRLRDLVEYVDLENFPWSSSRGLGWLLRRQLKLKFSTCKPSFTSCLITDAGNQTAVSIVRFCIPPAADREAVHEQKQDYDRFVQGKCGKDATWHKLKLSRHPGDNIALRAMHRHGHTYTHSFQSQHTLGDLLKEYGEFLDQEMEIQEGMRAARANVALHPPEGSPPSDGARPSRGSRGARRRRAQPGGRGRGGA